MLLSEAVSALVRAEIEFEAWISDAEYDEHHEATKADMKQRVVTARRLVDEVFEKALATRAV